MIAEPRYVPKPETRADMAIDFIKGRLRCQASGSWLANTEVAQFLGCRPNAVSCSLKAAVNAGLLERSTTSGGYTQWRIASTKPRRSKRASAASTFVIDWPPGFVPQFDKVKVAAWDGRK